MKIAGKVFAVTGAANGIGKEVARALLAQGASVAAIDLQKTALEKTSAELSAGPRLSTHAIDITDRDAVDKLPAEISSLHGTVDGLINIAGIIQQFIPVSELGFAEMERVFNVNFWGTINTCKAFLPHLSKRPEATIINTASMGAIVPVPGQSFYGASKAAVALFTQALYAELLETSVHAGIVYPGATKTNITENSGVAAPGQGADQENSAAAKLITSAADAANAYVRAIEKNAYRTTIGKDTAALDKLSRIAPKKATELIAKKMADLRK